MNEKKDETMSEEWDELLATPESLEFLKQSGEEAAAAFLAGKCKPLSSLSKELDEMEAKDKKK